MNVGMKMFDWDAQSLSNPDSTAIETWTGNAEASYLRWRPGHFPGEFNLIVEDDVASGPRKLRFIRMVKFYSEPGMVVYWRLGAERPEYKITVFND